MEFQIQSIMEEKVRMIKKKQKMLKSENPSEVKFICRGCNKDVCTGEDVEIIEKMHRVNLSPQFRCSLVDFLLNVLCPFTSVPILP